MPTFDLNHGPLTAFALPLIRWLADMGIDARFIVRVPAVVADAATTFMVFHVLRHRLGDRPAVAATALIALNPVLILISGFHGNTDPVFVAFLLGAVVLGGQRAPGQGL